MIFGFIYALIEYGIMGEAKFYPSTNNPYELKTALIIITSASLIMGLALGSVETYFLSKKFTTKPFGVKIFFKTGIYVFSIITMLLGISIMSNSIQLGLPVYDAKVVQTITQFISNFAFWSIVIYSGIIIVISLYFSETIDHLGGHVLSNFFTGKYHKPREEERIFMFLDMKSSTSIAEKLGHVRYFQLLNKYYADITDAIIKSSGEIYQYAGDEIIVTWSMKKGLHKNNCLNCFFMVKKILKREGKVYLSQFDLVPQFKAGLHYGKVTTGEIGVLRKEIFFTGDVLNTTARIQTSCNKLGTDILVSEDLIARLNLSNIYNLTSQGEAELRGKNERVKLFSIEEKYRFI